MELIGANRGIRTLNQPLETLSRNLTLGQALELPRYADGQITSLDEEQAVALKLYVEQLLSGELVVNAPTRFWRKDFTWSADRVVLKITDAKAVIGWFGESVDADVVYFSRHPVAQALSCIRNGWTLTSSAYLNDDRFMGAYLPEVAGYCRDLAMRGGKLERWVLNWALENVAPLRLLPDRPDWLHVKYEDTVVRPETELGRMAAHLSLDDFERMRARLRRPSVSSSRSSASTRGAIAVGATEALLDGWRTKVDGDDLRASSRVLERLSIDPLSVVPRW